VDNDCNRVIDDDAMDALTWYADSDSDTYGNPDSVIAECSLPSGYVDNDLDCDDTDDEVHPGGEDIRADGIDQDCDGTEVVWRQIDVAHEYACAIDTELSIHCWGDEASTGYPVGSYPDGTTDPPEGSYTHISTGYNHACAIEEGSRDIVCWGGCVDGECDSPPGDYISVAAGGWQRVLSYYYTYNRAYTCGVTTTGALRCWGGDDPFEDYPPPSSGRFTDVWAYGGFACAIDTGGEIHCWGPRADDFEPPAGDYEMVALSAYQHDREKGSGCALSTAGGVECWSTDSSSFWDDAPTSTDWTSISVAAAYVSGGGHRSFACGIDTAGSLDCWGDAYGGEDPSSGTYTDVKLGRPSSRGGYTWFSGCALRTDGLVDCFADRSSRAIVSDAPAHSG
jgi:hypothetical protein